MRELFEEVSLPGEQRPAKSDVMEEQKDVEAAAGWSKPASKGKKKKRQQKRSTVTLMEEEDEELEETGVVKEEKDEEDVEDDEGDEEKRTAEPEKDKAAEKKARRMQRKAKKQEKQSTRPIPKPVTKLPEENQEGGVTCNNCRDWLPSRNTDCRNIKETGQVLRL